MRVHLLFVGLASVTLARVQILHTGHFYSMKRAKYPEAVLSFHQLVENSDESFLLDNEALPLGSG